MNRAVTVLFCVSIAMVFGYQNCSDVSFQNESEAFNSIAFHDPSSRTMMQKYEIDSDITTTQQPMDVVWIVDNSGSMSEEAAWVESNVVKFANYLATASDARMTLVSKSSGTQGVQLPRQDERMGQIDIPISSTNALSQLANLLNGAHSSSTAFLGRWRAGVPKAIIVVSDDNSSISADEFLSQIPASFSQDIRSFNGIVALNDRKLSPCMARPGSVYMEMSHRIKGEIFNICDEDWTDIFSSLALNIEDQFAEPSKTRFELAKKNIERVVAVFINGEEIGAGEYSEIGGFLSVSKGAFLSRPSDKYEVSIEFIYQD